MNKTTRAMLITDDELKEILRAEVKHFGGLRRWAKIYNLSFGHISKVLCGRRKLSRSMAALLGYKREVMWREEDE